MDWKQISTGIVVGAILALASTFFIFQGRLSTVEEKLTVTTPIKSNEKINEVTNAIQQNAWYYLVVASPKALQTAKKTTEKYLNKGHQVAAFRTESGKLGVVLGPGSHDLLAKMKRELLKKGVIPSDSYISESKKYITKVYP